MTNLDQFLAAFAAAGVTPDCSEDEAGTTTLILSEDTPGLVWAGYAGFCCTLTFDTATGKLVRAGAWE